MESINMVLPSEKKYINKRLNLDSQIKSLDMSFNNVLVPSIYLIWAEPIPETFESRYTKKLGAKEGKEMGLNGIGLRTMTENILSIQRRRPGAILNFYTHPIPFWIKEISWEVKFQVHKDDIGMPFHIGISNHNKQNKYNKITAAEMRYQPLTLDFINIGVESTKDLFGVGVKFWEPYTGLFKTKRHGYGDNATKLVKKLPDTVLKTGDVVKIKLNIDDRVVEFYKNDGGGSADGAEFIFVCKYNNVPVGLRQKRNRYYEYRDWEIPQEVHELRLAVSTGARAYITINQC